MSTLHTERQGFPPLKHFPIAEPIEDLSVALKSDKALVQSLDHFYQNTLSELEPAKKEAAYLTEMASEIEAVFRINGAIVALLFSNKQLYCISDDIYEVFSPFTGQISASRIIFRLQSVYEDRVSIDYFTANRPTYKDYKEGYLFNEYDSEAGLKPDFTSLDEIRCEWLQVYQSWLKDYLYFNLAQISKDQHPFPQKLPSLSKLQNQPTFRDNQQIILTSNP
ncbi:MAG: hypothetical protein ACRBB6_11325 [Neptuniibacter sp.]